MAQLAFLVDLRKCIGCRACEAACKQENNVPIGARWRKVREVSGGKFPKPVVFHLSIACNHCDRPECMRVCPTNAYSKRKEDGIVELDRSKCIGCKYCIWACPYQAPQFEEKEGTVSKCHFCIHRIKKGLKPACVQACLTGALQFGTLNEIIKKYKNAVKKVEGFPDPSITGPSIRLIPPQRRIRK